MKCNKCKYVEMKMYKVDGDNMVFKCKQCGNEETVSMTELEKSNPTK